STRRKLFSRRNIGPRMVEYSLLVKSTHVALRGMSALGQKQTCVHYKSWRQNHRDFRELYPQKRTFTGAPKCAVSGYVEGVLELSQKKSHALLCQNERRPQATASSDRGGIRSRSHSVNETLTSKSGSSWPRPSYCPNDPNQQTRADESG